MVRLMDLKAVELLTEREFSLDKELRSIGVSNLLSAFCREDARSFCLRGSM